MENEIETIRRRELLTAFSFTKGYKKKRLEAWIEGYPEFQEEFIIFGVSCFIQDTFSELFPDVSDGDLTIIGYLVGKMTNDYLKSPEELRSLSNDKD